MCSSLCSDMTVVTVIIHDHLLGRLLSRLVLQLGSMQRHLLGILHWELLNTLWHLLLKLSMLRQLLVMLCQLLNMPWLVLLCML